MSTDGHIPERRSQVPAAPPEDYWLSVAVLWHDAAMRWRRNARLWMIVAFAWVVLDAVCWLRRIF